jgi:hypothetical protein
MPVIVAVESQWAAVMTMSGATSAPPQKCWESYWMDAA